VVVCSLQADKAIDRLSFELDARSEQASKQVLRASIPSGLRFTIAKSRPERDWSPAAACVVVTCKGNIIF
jgi:hypothetical protein